MNAKRSCVDIDAASYVFSVGVAAEGAEAAAMATKEVDARLREEEARSGGEAAATATAVRRRKEGIDVDDNAGAEVDGVALLQLRETTAAAAPRMPCKRVPLLLGDGLKYESKDGGARKEF